MSIWKNDHHESRIRVTYCGLEVDERCAPKNLSDVCDGDEFYASFPLLSLHALIDHHGDPELLSAMSLFHPRLLLQSL
jgi:hypothetical protein